MSHRVLAADLSSLRAARVLRFEDLVGAPGPCMAALLEWLGLPPAAVARAEVPRAAPTGALADAEGADTTQVTLALALALALTLSPTLALALALTLSPTLTLSLGGRAGRHQP